MSKTAWFLAFCFVVLLGCFGYLFDALMEPLESDTLRPQRRSRRAHVPRDETLPEDRLGDPAGSPAVTEVEAPARRELPVQGRVIGPDLRPAPDLILGIAPEGADPEEARVGPSGNFSFESRARPGTARLFLRNGAGTRAVWPGVVVGDLPDSPYDPGRPVYAWNLRWSLTICREEVFRRTVELDSVETEAPAKETDPAGGTDGEAPAPRVTHSASVPLESGEHLSIDTVLVEDWGSSGVAHLEGRAALPDGLAIYGAIYFLEDRLVATLTPGRTRQGRYRLSIPFPEEFHLHSGVYEARVIFSPGQEDLETLQEIQAANPEVDWQFFEREEYTVRQLFGKGSPDEESADDLKVASYYRDVYNQVASLDRVFRHRFGETLRLSRGWDPKLRAMVAARENPLLESVSVTEKGDFDPSDWRTFLDERWRPHLRRLLERHGRIEMEKFPRATHQMGSLLRGLLELSCLDSRTLYQSFNLPPSPLDVPRPEESLDVGRALLSGRIQAHFQALRRFQDVETLPRHEHAGWREGADGGGEEEEKGPLFR